ncbi:DUF4013 domain-containing protein [Candidatus Dojkabacteria bacterium]|nr:DUF4013 domain-containing protein [Candidatus Dojkabacteria bacterium]
MNPLESINKVLSDKRIIPKVGVILGLSFIETLIYFILTIITESTALFKSTLAYNEILINAINIVFGNILPIVISLLTLPVWIYTQGFLYAIANNVRLNENEVIPEHGDINKLMKLGGKYLSVRYSLTIPFVITAMIPALFFMTTSKEIMQMNNPNIVIFLILWIIICAILFSITLGFIDGFVVPAIMYAYLNNHNTRFDSILNSMKDMLLSSVRSSWPTWIFLFIINSLISLLTIFIRIISCILCIGVLVIPFIDTFTLLVNSAILGTIYYNMDRDLKNAN